MGSLFGLCLLTMILSACDESNEDGEILLSGFLSLFTLMTLTIVITTTITITIGNASTVMITFTIRIL